EKAGKNSLFLLMMTGGGYWLWRCIFCLVCKHFLNRRYKTSKEASMSSRGYYFLPSGNHRLARSQASELSDNTRSTSDFVLDSYANGIAENQQLLVTR
ncbi:hypothetical protein JXI42_04210, partial [bacterium]|nr:hypothetical protein [bacterium]